MKIVVEDSKRNNNALNCERLKKILQIYGKEFRKYLNMNFVLKCLNGWLVG